MKPIFPVLVFLLAGLDLASQPMVTSARAGASFNNGQVLVRQTFVFDTVFMRAVELKSLSFEGIAPANVQILEPPGASVNEQSYEGLTSFRVEPPDEGMDHLLVEFGLNRLPDTRALPLFYPDMPAASSENDLFEMTMRMSEDEFYKIYFPAVSFTEQVADGLKEVYFTLPAIPSMVSVLVKDSPASGLSTDQTVDWIVAGVFIAIGMLIWYKRGQFVYG